MASQQITPRTFFAKLLKENTPQAMAWVTGSSVTPGLSGLVKFYDTPYGGTLVEAEFFGLPDISSPNTSQFYAMHIHENGDCSHGFVHAGSHYNPGSTLHPYHAGDMLPLMATHGYAWEAFYDKRFQIKDIIGRTVIIHAQRDDFTSQPSGDSGAMIGCGVIRSVS